MRTNCVSYVIYYSTAKFMNMFRKYTVTLPCYPERPHCMERSVLSCYNNLTDACS